MGQTCGGTSEKSGSIKFQLIKIKTFLWLTKRNDENFLSHPGKNWEINCILIIASHPRNCGNSKRIS